MKRAGSVLLYGRLGERRLEASYARAFQELKWRVERFDANPSGQDLSWWVASRIPRKLTRGSLALRRLGARRRNESLVGRALEVEPDLVFLVNGALVMPDAVESLQDASIPVAVFHPDAQIPGNPNHRPEHLPVARRADACFVWSRKLRARLQEVGVDKVEYLPFAWDPQVFPYISEPTGPGPEVVFVGGWDLDRERLLEAVAEEFELEIWGPDYWGTRTRPDSRVRRCWMGRALRGREAAEAVANADIALNPLRRQNLPDGTNMRTFEVPGAGGSLIATRTAGAVEIYPEDEAGIYFESIDELMEKIAYYLNHSSERRAIARRGHEITSRAHRYVDRAEHIVQTMAIPA